MILEQGGCIEILTDEDVAKQVLGDWDEVQESSLGVDQRGTVAGFTDTADCAPSIIKFSWDAVVAVDIYQMYKTARNNRQLQA